MIIICNKFLTDDKKNKRNILSKNHKKFFDSLKQLADSIERDFNNIDKIEDCGFHKGVKNDTE